MNNEEKKNIIEMLLTHYKSVRDRIVNMSSVFEAKELLEETSTGIGACFCSNQMFEVYIYTEGWVDKYMPHDKTYWGPCPEAADTIDEIVERLEIRIDNLQKELNETL